MILNFGKLESVLLANWTKFIEYRDLLKLLTDIANAHLGGHFAIQKATFTRFEYTGDKFVVWIEYTVLRGPETFYLTSEFNATSTDFLHIDTV